MGKNQNAGVGRYAGLVLTSPERGHEFSLKRTLDLVATGGFKRPHFSLVCCGVDTCGWQDLGAVDCLSLPSFLKEAQPRGWSHSGHPRASTTVPTQPRSKSEGHADCCVPT